MTHAIARRARRRPGHVARPRRRRRGDARPAPGRRARRSGACSRDLARLVRRRRSASWRPAPHPRARDVSRRSRSRPPHFSSSARLAALVSRRGPPVASSRSDIPSRSRLAPLSTDRKHHHVRTVSARRLSVGLIAAGSLAARPLACPLPRALTSPSTTTRPTPGRSPSSPSRCPTSRRRRRRRASSLTLPERHAVPVRQLRAGARLDDRARHARRCPSR